VGMTIGSTGRLAVRLRLGTKRVGHSYLPLPSVAASSRALWRRVDCVIAVTVIARRRPNARRSPLLDALTTFYAV
jgi:hypothetical protein